MPRRHLELTQVAYADCQWNNDTIRRLERETIRAFVESCSPLLTGRVLDYGCGLQPYREIVEAAGGHYSGYDRIYLPGNVSGENIGDPMPLRRDEQWDAILTTQTFQYMAGIEQALAYFRESLRSGGVLVATYPTCWDEVEPEDLRRFTRSGMERLIREAGFSEIVRHQRRAEVNLGGFRFPLGYGLVARA